MPEEELPACRSDAKPVVSNVVTAQAELLWAQRNNDTPRDTRQGGGGGS